jgi:hypothetical protein
METADFINMLTKVEMIKRDYFGYYNPIITNCTTTDDLDKVKNEMNLMKEYLMFVIPDDKRVGFFTHFDLYYSRLLEKYISVYKKLTTDKVQSLQKQKPGNDEVDYIECIRKAIKNKKIKNNNVNDTLSKLKSDKTSESTTLINENKNDGNCEDDFSSSCSDESNGPSSSNSYKR